MELLENFLANLDNILLVCLGIASILSAVSMLILRNPMQVAIALVFVMVFLSGIYGLLGIHFIAAFQILIYVGAIMVFMLYIIMLLNVRDSSFIERYSKIIPYALFLAVGLIVLFFYIILTSAEIPNVTSSISNTFSVSEFSKIFLSEYWFEFILVAILLLFAIVAAISILKTNSNDAESDTNMAKTKETIDG